MKREIQKPHSVKFKVLRHTRNTGEFGRSKIHKLFFGNSSLTFTNTQLNNFSKSIELDITVFILSTWFLFHHSGGCHIAYPNSVCMQLEKTSKYPCNANTDAVKLLQHAGKLSEIRDTPEKLFCLKFPWSISLTNCFELHLLQCKYKS